MFTETQTHPFTGTVEIRFRDDMKDYEGEVVSFLPGGVVTRHVESVAADGSQDTALVFTPYDRILAIVQDEA